MPCAFLNVNSSTAWPVGEPFGRLPNAVDATPALIGAPDWEATVHPARTSATSAGRASEARGGVMRLLAIARSPSRREQGPTMWRLPAHGQVWFIRRVGAEGRGPSASIIAD